MKKFTFFIFVITICSVGSAFSQTNIRRVDFKNFTYFALCGASAEKDAWKATVKKATIKNTKLIGDVYKPIDENLPAYFDIGKIIYGDLTGDEREEAVITSDCNTGGTGQFTEGYIYTLKGGKPVLLSRIVGGDRGFGGLVNVRINRRFLFVERNDEEGAANCCATHTLTTKFRWNGKKFVAVGKPLRKKIVSP